MSVKKSPPVCTVDVDQFKQLVRDVARASDTDPSLPMINGVLLHGDTYDKKPILVGTATDRFILAHGSVDATGVPLPEVFIRLADIRRVLAVVNALPKESTLLEIKVTSDGEVEFSARGASVTVEPFDLAGGFVSFAKLFDVEVPAEGANRVAVRPDLITRIAAIAKVRREPMRIQAAGSNRVTTIQIGHRFRALIMPIKVEEVDVLPVFAPREASKERAA